MYKVVMSVMILVMVDFLFAVRAKPSQAKPGQRSKQVKSNRSIVLQQFF